jgi:hypothetical protein
MVSVTGVSGKLGARRSGRRRRGALNVAIGEEKLIRVHAYAVEPRRTDGGGDKGVAAGGEIGQREIRSTVVQAFATLATETLAAVDFNCNGETRTNGMRDLVMRYAFGESLLARGAAVELAERLSQSMDRRSKACLLLCAGLGDGKQRKVGIWTFPQDEAFQLRSGKTTTMKLLEDVFSRSSRLRKAAAFEGQDRKTDFLSGKVLDFQTNSMSQVAADFWIATFLDCSLGIRGDAGTRMLAKSIRATYDKTEDAAGREQLWAAIVAVRQSPQRRWSLKTFADRFLSGDVKRAFLGAAPNPESVGTSFDVQRDLLDKTLNFRVFRLKSNVYVSAPFETIGETVKVSENRLRCEDTIVSEAVRSRHG